MCLAANARDSLMTLVRLARSETAALTADLADIVKAMSSADAALAQLAEDMAGEAVAEEASAPRIERILSRRHSLFMTLEILDQAAEETRAKLDAAVAETKKLEALLAPDLAHGVRGMRLFDRPDVPLRAPGMRLAS